MTRRGAARAGLLAAALAVLAPAPGAAAGLVLDYMDPAVRPQDDLFRAANGRWLAAAAIPADAADTGIFREVRNRADEQVRQLVEALAEAAPPAGSDARKIADFYAAFLDEAAIDATGLAPLAPWLAQIDALGDTRALAALLGRWQGMVPLPIALSADPDPKQPDVYLGSVEQSGLGLPDRDYFLQRGARFEDARRAYRTYLRTLFELSADRDAGAHARQVEALERRLALAQWSQVESRDSIKRYNPMPLAELARRAPGLDWAALLAAGAMPQVQRLSVIQPSYARSLAREVQHTPLPVWKLYLRARLLDAAAAVLPQALRDASFAFNRKALRGLDAPRPRWRDALDALDGALGEAVGRLYVAEHFPTAQRERVQAMVRHLFEAYAASIRSLAWLGPRTRERALDKLAHIRVKIGHPDRWRDYAGLVIEPGDALGNLMRAGRFEYERTARRAGQPVDRDEWGTTPQTVNAFYNASLNEIVFPAAILQPPFFDMDADDAYNYGSTGATIGHEISHGFDDDGSRYDGAGRLAQWWTRADRRAFDALGARLAAQAGRYEVLPGKRLNGRLTLGENIADLAGLEIAYKAWRLSLAGSEPAPIDGLGGDQRFFLGYAQSWREKVREADLLRLLVSDPHAPSEFRVNGPVVHIDAFHRSFATGPGDQLYKAPAARLHIW